MAKFLYRALEKLLIGDCAYSQKECEELYGAACAEPITDDSSEASVYESVDCCEVNGIVADDEAFTTGCRQREAYVKRVALANEYRFAENDMEDGCGEDCFGPDSYYERVDSYNRFSLHSDDDANDYNRYSLHSDENFEAYNRHSMRPDARTDDNNRFSLKGDRNDHGQDYYDPYDDF